MILEGFRSAVKSIWNNKVRSLLTVVGIVIGVTSVTTLIALGQGLKNDVADLIQGMGSNIVFMVGGNIDTSNPQGMSSSPAAMISGDVITKDDVKTVQDVEGVEYVAPMSLAAGIVTYEGRSSQPTIFGTTSDFINALEILKVSEGRFFTKEDEGNLVAVVDKVAKDSISPDEDIIGKKILINKKKFEIIGLVDFGSGGSMFGDFSNMLAITQDGAKEISKGSETIHRVIIKVNDDYDVNEVKDKIDAAVLANHDGEDDFTVLTQDDMLDLMDQFLGLATALVSAIAAISLVVGGIGIMNIMLVTVTERTKEIGLRKAVGATKLDIAIQFLIESIMVTLVGGAIGLGISFAASYIVSQNTELTPSITLDVVAIAISVSMVIGVIFGLWPALRAANKDPITALRYE